MAANFPFKSTGEDIQTRAGSKARCRSMQFYFSNTASIAAFYAEFTTPSNIQACHRWNLIYSPPFINSV
jgi:hypothetical protein